MEGPTFSQEKKGRLRSAFVSFFAVIGIMSLVAFVSFIFIFIFSVTAISKSISSSTLYQGSSDLTFVTPDHNKKYIAGIKFNGEINDALADDIIEKLEYARDDKNALGILLEVNSPGGSVVPSQEIYDKVTQVIKKKPVVSYVREVAASGAYYSISPSSQIIANRGSMIGSIGVIMQGFDATELVKFFKVNSFTIKTGALKDTGSPLRPMTKEDKNYLQSMINATHDQFVTDVKRARSSMTKEGFDLLADGRVVLATQAQKIHMIDTLGSKDSAISNLQKLIKSDSKPDVFYYEKMVRFPDLITSKFMRESTELFKNNFLTPSMK